MRMKSTTKSKNSNVQPQLDSLQGLFCLHPIILCSNCNACVRYISRWIVLVMGVILWLFYENEIRVVVYARNHFKQSPASLRNEAKVSVQNNN